MIKYNSMNVNVRVEVGSINIFLDGTEQPFTDGQPLSASPVANPESTGDFVVTDNEQTSETATPISDEEDARLQGIIDRHKQHEIDETARVNFLRNLAMHANSARRLEGFQTNHQRHPRVRGIVDREQHSEKSMASDALKSACGVCALSNICKIKSNIDAWLDVHPYANDRTGTRRPGSQPVEQTESRNDFLKVLTKNPRAHCDPAKRN